MKPVGSTKCAWINGIWFFIMVENFKILDYIDKDRALYAWNIMKIMRNDPDKLEEYDFSKGIRGKYAKIYAEGTNLVLIDPDIAEFFPDHESINGCFS